MFIIYYYNQFEQEDLSNEVNTVEKENLNISLS